MKMEPSLKNNTTQTGEDRIKNSDDKKKNSIKYFLRVKPLSKEIEKAVLEKRIYGNIYFTILEEAGLADKIVNKNDLLITAQVSENSEDKNFDVASPSDNSQEENLSIGKEINKTSIGSNLYEKNNNYYAATDGLFVLSDNNKYQLLPVNKNAFVIISVSDDKMKVFANFYPPAKGGENLTPNMIYEEFKRKLITLHLNVGEMREIINDLKNHTKPIKGILVANGTKPVKGKEAWVEYLIDVKVDKSLGVTEDGRVDFYNLHVITSVTKDQKLAIYHPPIPGKHGVDVFGKIIPPLAIGKGLSPGGKNTYSSPDDKNTILAQIDGYLKISKGVLSVSDKYEVNGDIDFNTGNIISKGSIHIKGNVKSGFKLKLGKNVFIGGNVKNAKIFAGGNVIVNGGFSGDEGGVISAEGDVTLKYIRNQTVYSRNNIIINKEAIDTHLFARKGIMSANGKALIIGGSTIAGEFVKVHILGHEYGTPTRIQVGYDYLTLEEITKLTETIKKMEIELYQNELQIKKYSKITNLSEGGKNIFRSILIKYQKLKADFSTLSARKNELEQSLKNTADAKVTVTGIAYPGVEIIINKVKFTVSQIIRGKTFALSPTKGKIITNEH